MSGRFRLQLLGRFSLAIDGGEPCVVPIASARRRGLLAYLSLQQGFTETRERLADLLWGDRLDKQARQSLRQCLVSLRKDLGEIADDLLIVERDTIGLKPERLSVDARDFLALSASGKSEDRAQARDLYRGPFLEGIDLDVEPFRDWVEAERGRLAAAAARLFENHALEQDRLGQGAGALRAAERLVALDPAQESAQRLLLQLRARHGSRDAALAQADTLRASLRRELDAEPEPETRTLIEDIRRGAIAPISGAAARGVSARASGDAAPMLVPAPVSTGRRWTRFLGVARPVLVLAVAAGLASFISGDEPRPMVAHAAMVPPGVAGADPSWRSPAILPGVGADKTALAVEGRYAAVVLPFATDAAKGPERALADGITDDLINDLSRVAAFRVISRATSRLYRDRPVDVAAVGAELGVRYVVEGDVRLQDGSLRVNVALTDAATRIQVWAERFEREGVDRRTLTDDITRAIARQLHVEVLTLEDRKRSPAGAADAGIADLLAKGWAAMLRIGATGTTSGADGYFEEVLARDPENVSALTGFGGYNVSVVAMFLVDDRESHLVRGAAALEHAIRNDPQASLPYYFQGILEKTRGHPHEALVAFTKVLERNPSFAPAYAQIGHVLSRIGRLNEAMENVRYAIRLSPRDPNLGLWSLFGGEIELELGQDEAATDWLRRAAVLDPQSPFMHAGLAAAYALRDDPAAAEEAAEVRKLAPWLTPEQMIDRLVGLSDSGSEPRRLMTGLHKAFPGPT